MTNDNRQAAWDTFMQKFLLLVQDPEQVLGKPTWRWESEDKDDLQRYWHWDDMPWAFSTFDQRDKHSRQAKWYSITGNESLTEQHLVAVLREDGTVQRVIMTYWRTEGAGLVQVDYKGGKAELYQPSVDATEGELPDLQVLAELIREIPERLLA